MINKRQIIQDVQQILEYSQDYPFSLNCRNLINQWHEAKKHFIKAFGGQLIIQLPDLIKIELSAEQRARRFKDFMAILDDNGVLTSDFEDFLLQNQEGFYDNRVLKNYSKYNVPQGMKLSKSFKKFLTNTEMIRQVQDTASKFIQENKIEGYLYLSVDPRDFVTLSENNANWWSCQSLDGDYRAGNLSYMVDPTTIVAYLASDKQGHLKCAPFPFVWNSKKWRMLVHTDLDKIAYYNRQYPYNCSALVDKVYEMLSPMAKQDWTKPFDCGVKRNITTPAPFREINLGGRTFDIRDILNQEEYLGYSDLISSHAYSPTISLSKTWFAYYMEECIAQDNGIYDELDIIQEAFNIPIGKAPTCPCCGEEMVYRENSFLCLNCIAEHDADEDFYISCAHCGRRIYPEDEEIIENGESYCKNCFYIRKQEE